MRQALTNQMVRDGACGRWEDGIFAWCSSHSPQRRRFELRLMPSGTFVRRKSACRPASVLFDSGKS